MENTGDNNKRYEGDWIKMFLFNDLKYKVKLGQFLMYLTLLLLVLSGCIGGENSQSGVIGNPKPADFLKDGDADIFVLLGNIVYSNGQDIEWVNELDYSLGEQIGEITKQTDEAGDFENNTANKLPIGTKIYETDTPAYIAVVEGKKLPYIKMLEG